MRNRFSLLVIVRIAIILTTSLLFIWLWGNPDLYFTRLLLFLISISLIVELLFFVNRTNRELVKFIDAIQYEDRNVHFSLAKLGGGFGKLQNSFQMILKAIQQAKIEKEAQLKFLQVLLDQIPVGILAIREGEHIELMNRNAGDLLHISNTTQWSYLRKIRADFCNALEGPKAPSQQIIHVEVNLNRKRLSTYCHRIKVLEVDYTLVTFQDIQSEMERQEMESWQKLIKILTHEIMNSITPLSSLTDTLLMVLHPPDMSPKKIADLEEEDLEDIRYSLRTIRDRSEGLMRFVEDYRRLYKVPTPQTKLEDLPTLLATVHRFLKSQLETASCQWSVQSDSRLVTVRIDATLIEQVLINLTKNALEAMTRKKEKALTWTIASKGSEVLVSIRDRGEGIEPQKLDQIFVPFFTTKSEGSGIGLSLSRQIMFQHGGRLTAQNHPEGGAIFTLAFPAIQQMDGSKSHTKKDDD